MKLTKIRSLAELAQKARQHPEYAALAINAANNLGGNVKDVDKAMRWLNINAMETDEDGVVAEVNFCI